MLVKATQHVQDRLHRQILQMANSECKSEFGSSVEDALCNIKLTAATLDKLYWGEYLPFRSKLPAKWFNTIDSGSKILLRSSNAEVNQHCLFESHRIGNSWSSIGGTNVLHTSVTSKSPAFMVVAPSDIVITPDEHSYNPVLSVNNWSASDDLKKARQTAVSIIAIVDKWRAVHAKITKLLDSTKSVNEAVKLWPELVTFLDPEDRQRLEKQGTTKKARESRIDAAKKALAEIDTQSIVADVVGIKLAAA